MRHGITNKLTKHLQERGPSLEEWIKDLKARELWQIKGPEDSPVEFIIGYRVRQHIIIVQLLKDNRGYVMFAESCSGKYVLTPGEPEDNAVWLSDLEEGNPESYLGEDG